MKNKLSVVALSAIAGVALLSLAADSSRPKVDGAESLAVLRAQITDLRAQVDTLRQRTKSLESAVDDQKRSRVQIHLDPMPAPATPPTLPVFTPAPHDNSSPPTIWGTGEVNGWTYYIVPCEQQAR